MTSETASKPELAEAIMNEDFAILAALTASDREQFVVAHEVMERRKDALRELSGTDSEPAK